jgi:inner membrane transporter RhtA
MSLNKSIALILLGIISIQAGASIAKDLFAKLGAEGATAMRIFFASIILLSIFRPWQKTKRLKFDKKTRKIIFFYGTSLGIMNLLFYKALETLPQGIVVAVEFLGPLSVAVFLSRKFTDFLWAALAVLGLFLLLPLNIPFSEINLNGFMFCLGAGLFWALYIIFGQRLGTNSQGAGVIAYGMCIASIVTIPFGVAVAGSKILQIEFLPRMLLVALLSSVIPYTLDLIALKKVPAKTFGILMSLEPAVAGITAFFFLNEKLSILQWAGVVSISLASLGTTLSARKNLVAAS